jgi:hypothetical protein
MTFRVNSKALAGLPPHLDRRRDDLLAAGDYVTRNARLAAGGGLTGANVMAHEAIVGSVLRYLSDAAGIYAGGDADRVRIAMAGYAGADLRAAARADATLPSWHLPVQARTPPDAKSLGPEIFDDSAQPRFDLSPPGDHEEDIPYTPTWSDLLSPTSALRDAIYEISKVGAAVGLLPHPVDAFDTFVRPFVGDWPGMLRVAEVFDNVAELLGDTAEQLDRVDRYVPLVWLGNAADGCRANITHFTVALRLGLARLHYIAGVYREVATGVHANGQLLESMITIAGDALLDGAIDIATSTFGFIYTMANQVADEISLIQQLQRLTHATISIVLDGFSLSDETAHRLGILTAGDFMPDMTQPFATAPETMIRRPLAFA